jgi:RNAse (barnase) inhibitor barstar
VGLISKYWEDAMSLRLVKRMSCVFTIDGAKFHTLEEFYDEVSAVLIPGAEWGRNLDAFNDILRGGFGTPDSGFIVCWRNVALSRQRLGYAETIRQLHKRRLRCDPSNGKAVQQTITEAESHRGETVFDWLVEIIRAHGPGGDEAEDHVILELHEC